MKTSLSTYRDKKSFSLEMLDTLDQLVLIAPNTSCDPYKKTTIPPIPLHTLGYLVRHVKDEPWVSQLTLMTLIMASRNYDESSIYSLVSLIHSKIKVLYKFSDHKYKPSDFSNFLDNFDYLLKLYLEGKIAYKDTKETRVSFFTRFKTATILAHDWLKSVPFEFKAEYKKLLFSIPNENLYFGLIKKREIIEDQQQRRKTQVDTLMPFYAKMRSTSHIRWNFICRLEAAYNEFLTKTLKKEDNTFPIEFIYTDDNFKYNFCLWNVESFIKIRKVILERPYNPLKIKVDLFPELISIINTLDNTSVPIENALWFAEPLKHACSYPNFTKQDKDWQNKWEYSLSSFASTQILNLMYWNDRALMKNLQQFSQGLLIPIQQLHLALSFGILALDLFTTTGIRINEALQINLSKECLVRLILPPVSEAKNKSPIIRYSLRLIPKGEKRDQLEDNFIGEETKRLLFKVGKILHKHYNLQEGQNLPIIPFNPHHRRAHRFKSAPYIFQAYGKHLPDSAIGACLRLLVHDIVTDRTKNGKVLQIRPHLLRHGFATHAVQVEKIPVDIVGKWLHQKSVPVTQYYSQVTDSMVADAADQYLITIASHINVLDAVQRSPQQLRDIYQEASQKQEH
ncbi:site-specific integrase [Acinetobacter haemolyticus]|nr:site-specific integrase [Acinetobacter haemolyticus]